MSERAALELELKKLVIEALALEDIEPDEIVTGDPLFVEGLGLDSIDALEITMVLEERYHVQIEDDAEQNKKIFASIAALAEFVASNLDANRS
jgi:acyl carrier protein